MNHCAERRQSHRVRVCGSAILHAGGGRLVCRIVDLSTGGIGIRCEEFRGFDSVIIGADVEIDLQLDPRQGLRVSHLGIVRHIDASAGRLGISFLESATRWQDPVAREEIAARPALRVVGGRP